MANNKKEEPAWALDFTARQEPRCPEFETERDKEIRHKKEKLQEEIRQEEKMLTSGVVDEDLIMFRIEHYILDTNCDYYHLCYYALYSRPAWRNVIRKNTNHIVQLIESFTAWRQHRHNVTGEPGTDARRSVKYDMYLQ